MPNNSTAQKVYKRENEPHSRNAFLFIIAPFANGHEADVRIILADTGCKLFGLLPDLMGIDDAIGAQCANRLKSLLSKSIHQLV